jgi:peptide/nickel transport system substrate-binding protein
MSVLHRVKGRKGAWTLAAAGVVIATALATAAFGVAESPASTKASAAPCKPKNQLTYGISGAGISALDPASLSFAGQLPLQSLLYNSLTEYTPDGSVVPDLATKFKHSDDLKTWWFWLRRDVKYANGRPFTSADVVANVLRNLDPKVPSLWGPAIKDIRSVRAITKYEVRFKLGGPSAILPEALVPVEMSDLTDVSKLNTVGNGTGPYKVADFVPDQSLTLVPNTKYYGPPPCLQKIVFVREPDPTSMVTDFASGKLSVIWQVPLTALPTVQRDSNAYVVKPKSVSSEHVWDLDNASPPFNNPLARQALAYAIDKETMVKVAFFGLAKPSLANDLISTASPIYDKTLTPYKFNLDKAKQLFDQAGVKPGTTFTFWALAGRRDEWITMAQILQQDLQKIGLNLKIERNDLSTWLAKFNPAGKRYPNMIIGDFYSLPPNPIAALGYVTSGRCNCNWNNKQYDALLLKATATPDPVKRQVVYNQMQELFSKQVPLIAMAHQTNIIAAQKNVTGIWEDPAGTARLQTARVGG